MNLNNSKRKEDVIRLDKETTEAIIDDEKKKETRK